MKRYSILMFIVAAALIFAACQKQQEAQEEKSSPAITNQMITQTIQNHILSSLSPDSTYAITDEVENRTRQLKLDSVHETVYFLANEGKYYSCADMTEGTDKLDVDFYVLVENDTPKVSEVVIHKVNGESRK